MHKYTRKYYINDKEVSFEIMMKYIEIMLTHSDKTIKEWGVVIEDVFDFEC